MEKGIKIMIKNTWKYIIIKIHNYDINNDNLLSLYINI